MGPSVSRDLLVSIYQGQGISFFLWGRKKIRCGKNRNCEIAMGKKTGSSSPDQLYTELRHKILGTMTRTILAAERSCQGRQTLPVKENICGSKSQKSHISTWGHSVEKYFLKMTDFPLNLTGTRRTQEGLKRYKILPQIQKSFYEKSCYLQTLITEND